MSNIKDTLSTFLAIILVGGTAVQQSIQSFNGGNVNWWVVGFAGIGAIALWLQGKNSDGTTKTSAQLTSSK